jgi:hypothetical protein
MARYNEILTGRHNNFIKKLFSMKGEAPAPQMASEIMMVHPISHGSENRFLETWNRYAVADLVAAGVGTVSGIALSNPAASNVIAVLEKIAITPATSQEVDLSMAASAAAFTVRGTSSLDGRQLSSSSLIFSDATSIASFGAIIGRYQIQAAANPYDVIGTDIQEFNLSPGQQLRIINTVANNTLLVTLVWRERFLEDSERA